VPSPSYADDIGFEASEVSPVGFGKRGGAKWEHLEENLEESLTRSKMIQINLQESLFLRSGLAKNMST
jgi:hypothetical protein